MTEPQYFDAHSHVTFRDYDADRDAVLARMRDEGVWTATVGVDLKTSEEAVRFAEDREGFFATIGLHPNYTAPSYIGERGEFFEEKEFEELVRNPNVIAVGECGLDYFRMEGDREEGRRTQMQEFEKQMVFAIAHDKSLMIHCRPSKGTMDAYEDLLAALDPRARGNIHFFVGSLDIAKRFWEREFTTSFTGVLTFTHDYDEVVREAPLDMLLTETDAPYATPEPHRGERNEPGFVKHVVEAIARIRGEASETVQPALIANARRVFGF